MLLLYIKPQMLLTSLRVKATGITITYTTLRSIPLPSLWPYLLLLPLLLILFQAHWPPCCSKLCFCLRTFVFFCFLCWVIISFLRWLHDALLYLLLVQYNLLTGFYSHMKLSLLHYWRWKFSLFLFPFPILLLYTTFPSDNLYNLLILCTNGLPPTKYELHEDKDLVFCSLLYSPA